MPWRDRHKRLLEPDPPPVPANHRQARIELLADILAIQEFERCLRPLPRPHEIEPLVALFAPDALGSNGPRVSRGRAEIDAFYRSRTAQGVRTAADHIRGESQAHATSVWLSFAQNSAPPIDYSIPFLVADFEDVYDRGADGEWRILSRHIRPSSAIRMAHHRTTLKRPTPSNPSDNVCHAFAIVPTKVGAKPFWIRMPA